MEKKLLLYFKITVLFCFVSLLASADQYTYVGKNNDWQAIENWQIQGKTPQALPDENDDVVLNVDNFQGSLHKISLNAEITLKSLTLRNSTEKRFLLTGAGQLNLKQKFSGDNNFDLHLKKLSLKGESFDFDPRGTLFSTDLNIESSKIKFNSALQMQDSTLINLDDVDVDFGNYSHRFYDVSFFKVNLKEAGESAKFLWIQNHIETRRGRGNNDDLPLVFDKSKKDGPITCGTPPDQFTIETVVTTDYNGSDISCNGADDAQVCVNVTGGSGSFNFQWIGGPSTQCWNNLGPGNYSVIVTDQVSGVNCGLPINVSEPADITSINFITTEPDCNGSCNGSVSHVPFGGTGSLSFSWSPGGQTVQNPNDLCAGPNTLTITDDNGCTFDTTIIISEPPAITVNNTVTDVLCNGDCDGTITANASGGTGSLSYQWFNCTTGNPIPGETNPMISGLCPGSYYVEVTDDNGCMTSTSGSCNVVNEPPVLSGSLSNITNASCPGVCDGTATFTPTGGTSPYSIEWFDVPTNTSQGTGSPITTLCGGQDFYAVVTDDNGCTFTSADFTINNNILLTVSGSSTNMSCFGVCDGSATAVPSGGTAPYTYQWTNLSSGTVIGGGATVNGLCAGDYEVIAIDDNGCMSEPDTVTVVEPPQIQLSLNETNITCFNACDGSVQATPTGGTSPYSYDWTPTPTTGQSTSLAEDLCAGNWEVEVTDDNGCSITDDIDITEPPQYDLTTNSTNIDCNSDCNGQASVTVNNGGTPGYTYTWTPVPPSGQGVPTASGLCAGNWEVEVVDVNGCDTTIQFNITEPPPLSVSAAVVSDVTCNSDCDGSADVTIGGGSPGYNILWDDPAGQTTTTASGLCANSYQVTVTDANGCTGNDNVTITEPDPFDLTVSSTDVDCNGDCTGTGTVTVNSGGTPSYFISWNDPLNQNTFTATSLCAGTYQATVSDQNGCDTVVDVTINEPPPLNITVNTNTQTCFGQCTGELSVGISGGSTPYSFQWFDGGGNPIAGETGTTISNLCAGDYYIEVTDGNGCVTSSPTETITEQTQITASSTVDSDATCGMCDGSATVTASGGAGGFNYNWSPAPGGGQGTQTATGLCGSVYNVTITDADGCAIIETVNVGSQAAETITTSSTDATCNGDCDGTATANFTCIDTPCSVEWFDNTGTTTGQTTTTATGLCAGDYTVVLTTGSGCTTSEDVTVSEPPVINVNSTVIDNSCNSACDGSISLNVSGGVSPYSYSWTPLPPSGAGTDNITNLCAGSWSVDITDGSGCVVTQNFTIAEPTAIDASNLSSSDVSCFGSSDGSVSVIPTDGQSPYSYEWTDCATGSVVGNTQLVNNLDPGSYQVEVTDDNGCTTTSACVDVDEPAQLTGTVNVANITCQGDCDGLLDVVPSGGLMNISVQWLDASQNPLPGETDDTLNNLCEGDYYVQLEDLNGCTEQLGPFTITEPSSWDVAVSQTNVDCFGDCTGSADATVNSGNTPPYTHAWDDPSSQTTPIATGLCAGNYNVVITDVNGCDTTINYTINENPEIIANGTVTDVSCFGDCDGGASVTPSGGASPYSYSWSTSSTSSSISGQCAGSYNLTITDANGCTKDTTFVINEPSEIIANIIENDASCSNCNGSAVINPSGGSGGYSYNWVPAPGVGQGTNNGTSMCAGTYSVTVTDSDGCSEVFSVSISDIDGITPLNTSTVDVSCFGACDGEASVSYTCNDPPCTQQWFDNTGTPIGQTTLTASNLCAGNYSVEVNSASGCVSVAAVTITEPTQIEDNETISSITCGSTPNGSISVAPSGGSGSGYSYNWFPAPGGGQGTNTATGLSAGTWNVEITDGSGCIDTFTYMLTAPSNLNATFSSTDASCNGTCDGTISITASGGSPPYSYQWFNNGTVIAGATSNVLQNLCSGNYNVIVTDDNGCTFTFSVPITISEPTAINANITSTNILCNGQCTGEATVSPSGGVAPYTIDWYDGSNNLIGQTGPTASNLCVGDYYAIITDDNGCTSNSSTVTITEPVALSFSISSNDATCFGQCNGDASISVSGGATPYSYNWTNSSGAGVPGGSMSAVSNLCAGTYTVEVTDDNGCSIGPATVVINENSELTGTIATNQATCGMSNGSATVNANGGTSPYTYQWFDNSMTALAGETSNSLTNISAGTYFVTVTDNAGCTETFTANISNPNTTNIVFDNVTDVSCNGGCDGSIEITASPANPPLSYAWNPGGISAEDPVGLCAGTYTLQVTDDLGCINYYDTIIEENTAIDGTFTTNEATCGECNGDATVMPTGGSGNYTFIWSTGSTTNQAQNLCAGVHDVVVTDDNGCSNILSVSISNTGGPTGENLNVTNVSCAGNCDGSASVTPIGGTPPYTYNWVHNGATTNSLSNLCEGNYSVEIIDSNDCKRVVDLIIDGPTPLDIDADITPPDCGSSNGQILITASGGSIPYTYSWNTLPNGSTQTGIGQGTYNVTVTDGTGCSKMFTVNVDGNNAPSINLTTTQPNCDEACDGSVSSSVSGGSPSYTYTWIDGSGAPIPGETNPNINNLCAGDYTLQVDDAAGCSSFKTVSIINPDTVQLSTPTVDDAVCYGDCNGSATAVVSGGTIPYSFSWDDPANQTTVTANSLCAGNFTLTVTDANGCTVEQTTTVDEPPELLATIDSTHIAQCVGNPDGDLFSTISGGVPPYTINWTSDNPSFSSNMEDLIGVEPGDYYIELTDDKGCVFRDTANIDTASPITAVAGPDTTLCNGESFMWIGQAQGANGDADYTWLDSNGAVVSDTNVLDVTPQAGNNLYILMVEDTICSNMDTMVVTVGAPVLANAGPDQELLEGLSTMIGGNPTAPVDATIEWSPSTFLSDVNAPNPDVIEVTEDVTYILTVTDTNGCVNMDTVNVILLPELEVPNGISPNGDGKNDTWVLNLTTDFPDLEVEVYNRWGDQLFYSKGYTTPWDGTYKGEKVPVGTYYYVIKLNHPYYPEPFSGPITIMR